MKKLVSINVIGRYLLLLEKKRAVVSRLGHENFVDMWCRVEDGRLKFINRNHSKLLRVATRSS